MIEVLNNKTIVSREMAQYISSIIPDEEEIIENSEWEIFVERKLKELTRDVRIL